MFKRFFHIYIESSVDDIY